MDNNNITLPIEELRRRFTTVLHRLPILVGNEVVNFALDNFKRQAWLGETIQPWPARKNPTKWGMPVKRNSRSLLVDTGRLRRDITYANKVTSIDSVRIVISNPYARAHNEGLRLGEIQQVKTFGRKKHGIATVQSIKTHKSKNIIVQTGVVMVKAHQRRINQNIPARRFIGNSPYLNARLQRVVASEILKSININQ